MTSSHQVATLAGQVENLGHEFSLFGYPKGLFTLAIFARRDFHLLMDVNEWINYECLTIWIYFYWTVNGP